CLHSAPWWRWHWQRSSVCDVEIAETMPDGWQAWLSWQHRACPDNRVEIDTVQADRGRYLGYVRVVGRRRTHATLDKPIVSLARRLHETPPAPRSVVSNAR
ncbi:MAG: hypothetical protein LC775_15720, partial [Acidobacteria bacterium]|nr:hypothetical protein [Acidobacteriota bacterium]